MQLKSILMILEMIISFLLILVVLLQVQGTGLSLTFGGSGSFYRSKRGIEKLFFYATIGLSILFLVNAYVIYLL